VSHPVISVIVTTKRPKFWSSFCKSFYSNKIPFEIVFVGPNSPISSLPKNVKYIKTNVKPVQCLEIAYRNSEGEFIFHTGDDLIFSDKILDILHDKFSKTHDDRNIISPRFKTRSGRLKTDSKCLMAPKQPNSPLIALCGGIIKKETWENLGGLDNRFITALSIRDLFLRVYGIGGKLIYCDESYVREIPEPNPKKRLWYLTRQYDQPKFLSCWVRKTKIGEKVPSDSTWCYYNEKKKQVLSRKRLKKIKKFNNENLLIISQGRNLKNKWN